MCIFVKYMHIKYINKLFTKLKDCINSIMHQVEVEVDYNI